MNVGRICQRLVFTVSRSDEIIRAARLMREKHVGFLVVVEPEPVTGLPIPVGVLTDRDIVTGVLASDVDPLAVRVGDIMTTDPVTAQETDPLEKALHRMREFGVRRLPIVNLRHVLVGVLAIDDILKVLAGDTQDIVSAIANERRAEGRARP